MRLYYCAGFGWGRIFFTGVGVALCERAGTVLAGVKPPQLPMLKSASLVPPEPLFLKAGSGCQDAKLSQALPGISYSEFAVLWL